MFLLGILVEIMVRVYLQDQKLVASTIMNKIMDVFNINIIYTCVTIMVLAEVVKFLIKKYSRRLAYLLKDFEKNTIMICHQ